MGLLGKNHERKRNYKKKKSKKEKEVKTFRSGQFQKLSAFCILIP